MTAHFGQFAAEVRLDVVQCDGCGSTFAVPSGLYRKYCDGGSLRCPNTSCSWPSFHLAENDVARMKRELAEEKRKHEFTKNALAVERRQVANLRKRVGHGTCPCCKRTFSQLARHMKAKHPDFSGSKS